MAWMIMTILLLVLFSFDIGLAFGGIFWVLVFLFGGWVRGIFVFPCSSFCYDILDYGSHTVFVIS
jgi:hypothetical protein